MSPRRCVSGYYWQLVVHVLILFDVIWGVSYMYVLHNITVHVHVTLLLYLFDITSSNVHVNSIRLEMSSTCNCITLVQ